MNRPRNSALIIVSSGSAWSSFTKSSSHRVPMIEMSGLVPPEMSVCSFCNRLSQLTTSTLTVMSGLALWKSSAIFWKYGPVAAL